MTFKCHSKLTINFEPPLNNVFAYNAKEPLNFLGRFTTNVLTGNTEASAEFHVLNQTSPCILGYDTASKLNIIHILQTYRKIQENLLVNL